MRLTTKGRYAVTAMMDLALHGEGTAAVDGSIDRSVVVDSLEGINKTHDAPRSRKISLADIARNQDISLSYLEQLFAKLRREGLVHGVRGPGGGYTLARDPDDISIAQIVTAVDEKVDVTRCGGRENCQEGERCLSHELWTDLSQQIYEYMDGISLGEIVRRPNVCQVAARQDSRSHSVAPPSVENTH